MSQTDALYTLIKEIFLLLDDGDRRLLAQFDLTVPRFCALFHLGNEPGLSVSRLSDLMFCDKSNITRLIHRMEAEALVERRPHETDRRILRLSLTPAGEDARREVLAAHRECNRRRLSSHLGRREQRELLATLQQLKESLQVELGAEFGSGENPNNGSH